MSAAQQQLEGMDQDTVDFAREKLNAIDELNKQIKSWQEKKQSHLEDLQAQGISKKAAKRVLSLRNLDREKLEKEDQSEAICRKALGIGVQLELVKDDEGE